MVSTNLALKRFVLFNFKRTMTRMRTKGPNKALMTIQYPPVLLVESKSEETSLAEWFVNLSIHTTPIVIIHVPARLAIQYATTELETNPKKLS